MDLILDTDIGSDCDDAMALAMLNVLHNQKKINLLAVTHTTSVEWGGACIESINRFYGNDEISIGVLKDEHFIDSPQNNVYAQALAERYCPRRRREDYPDARLVLRNALEASNEKITLVCIGQLRNLAKFLKYKCAVGYGADLIAAKVSKVVIMGGDFSEERPEYNILCDIASAQNVSEYCPVPLYFVDFSFGNKVFTRPNKQNAEPVWYAYKCFGVEKRESWDPLTALFACGLYDEMFKTTQKGRVTFDNMGVSRFSEGDGDHYILKPAVSARKLEEAIENIVNQEEFKCERYSANCLRQS